MFEVHDYWGLTHDKSNIPYDFEILKIFFETKNVIIQWIDCNRTWGTYNSETERWTGAVGQVNINIELMHSPEVELNEIFVANIFN